MIGIYYRNNHDLRDEERLFTVDTETNIIVDIDSVSVWDSYDQVQHGQIRDALVVAVVGGFITYIGEL